MGGERYLAGSGLWSINVLSAFGASVVGTDVKAQFGLSLGLNYLLGLIAFISALIVHAVMRYWHALFTPIRKFVVVRRLYQ